MSASWSDVRQVDAPVWPSPVAVLLAVLIMLAAVWLGAEQNAGCERWARGDAARLAECDRLSR